MSDRLPTLVIVMLIAVLILLSIVPPILADSAVSVSTLRQSVNIRSGPGLEYTIRSVLYHPATVGATGRSDFDPARPCLGDAGDYDMWLRIHFNEMEGWVARCVVQVAGEVAALPVVSPSHAQEMVIPQERVTLLRAFRVDGRESLIGYTNGRVHLRSEPGLHGEILGIIAPGQSVIYRGRSENGGWIRVEFGVYSGWVARNLLLLP